MQNYRGLGMTYICIKQDISQLKDCDKKFLKNVKIKLKLKETKK